MMCSKDLEHASASKWMASEKICSCNPLTQGLMLQEHSSTYKLVMVVLVLSTLVPVDRPLDMTPCTLALTPWIPGGDSMVGWTLKPSARTCQNTQRSVHRCNKQVTTRFLCA